MRIIYRDADKETECYHCGTRIGYDDGDVCEFKGNQFLYCPRCGKRIFLEGSDATPETIEYPTDFYLFQTKSSDCQLAEQVKEAISQMKEDGDLGYVSGDALVIAIKDCDDSDYAHVFVCKNYAESSVKIS